MRFEDEAKNIKEEMKELRRDLEEDQHKDLEDTRKFALGKVQYKTSRGMRFIANPRLNTQQPISEEPLVALIQANNKTARALIDTATIGANLISTSFCYQNGIRLNERKTPLELSMTVKGSKTKAHKEVTLILSLGN